MKIPTKKYLKIMLVNFCVIVIIFILKALIYKQKFEFDIFLIVCIGYLTPYLLLCDKEKINRK